MKAWISSQLDSTTCDKISCPECSEIMQNANIKVHAAKGVYARFDELEKRSIKEKIPGWRWCLAANCKAGQVHQPLLEVSPNAVSSKARKTRKGSKKAASDNICTCNECGAKACVNCDRPWHEGETCAELQGRMKKQNKEEKEALKVISKVCKECPKCNKNIERNGGCDHMVCKCS